MKCPHCLTSIFDESGKESRLLGEDCQFIWHATKRVCPECKKFIISLEQYDPSYGSIRGEVLKIGEFLCYPKTMSREPLSSDVPDFFAEDYKEACLVLADSPKASAALSRRCLQNLLRDKAKVIPGNLAGEIQQVLNGGQLPSLIQESLDAIRNIGNFAAHPLKDTSSGQIIDVELGEAEWNLDVLESLFDYYFVLPANIQRKRDALNKKLRNAGKPEMK